MAEEIKKVDLLEGAENNPDNLLVVKNLKDVSVVEKIK